METIQAYKCGYCGKVYENKSSCKNHEYKCYFNPITKSCASCAFLKLEAKDYKPHHQIAFQVCLVNIDIGKIKLQTKCKKYLNKKYSDDKDIMDLVIKDYDPSNALKGLIEKLNLIKKKTTGLI